MSRIAPLLIVLALCTSCASVVSPTSSVQHAGAERAAADGDHLAAARAWVSAAGDSRGAARDHAWLMAADQYLLAGDAGAARQAFEEVNRRRLAGADLARHDLLAATFLGDADPVAALSRLGATPSNLPEDLRVRWHAMRADLLERAGRPFDAAAELALLASIQDRDARNESTRRIESLLADASDADLARGSAALRPGHPLYPHAARALTRRGLALPRPLERGESFAGLDQLPPADADGYRPPTRLGVLLPLSGPLATAGQSVRDGILAGYYGESRRRPEIQFYDTAGHAGGVRSAIARARDEGAQMLLGPLTREEVGAVFSSIDVDVPVIALNRVPGTPPPGSTTFALAPEEEGVAAADRLADRGFRNVLVVSQNDDGAMRALNAFRQRFAERGGSVAGDARVSEDQPDYLPTLQRAMAGMRPDALFLALKAPAARLLSSQMDAAGLTGVPRVATSLILSGANLRQDTELDGIEFPELPWLLGQRGGGLPDSDTLGGTLPSAKGGGARLFAFGHDAWKLAGYLDKLLTDPGASVRGATGELRLDAMGNVQRAPAWAVFSGGRPRAAMDGALLPESPSY